MLNNSISNPEEKPIPKTNLTSTNKSPGNPIKIIVDLSCKLLSFFGCVLPLILIVILFILVVFRPPFLWNTTKKMLNSKLTLTDYQNIKDANDPINLNTRIKETKEGRKLILTTSELATSIKPNLDNPEKYYLKLSPGEVTIVANIEDQNQPLLMYFKLKVQGNQLVLTKVGFGLFPFPDFLTQKVQSDLLAKLTNFKVLNLNELSSKIFNINNVNIAEVKIDLDQLIIIFNK